MIRQYAAEMKRCRVGPTPAFNVPAAPQRDQPGPVKHWGVSCNATGTYPIDSEVIGLQYKKRGAAFDLCGAAFAKVSAAEQAQYINTNALRPPHTARRASKKSIGLWPGVQS